MIRSVHLFLCAVLLCAAALAQDAPPPGAPGLGQQPKVAPAPSAQASPPQTPSAKEERVIPASAERHFHQAMLFERDGNVENAIEQYKAAIGDYPDYYAAHYNLGRLYLDKHGYSEAIAELRTAVTLRPEDANAHNNLGLALKHNRDLAGALQQYQEAVRLNPKMASAQNNLANILYLNRDFNGAIQHYRAALALEPKDSDKLSAQARSDLANTHTNLGSALDDAGKPEEAITEYKEALRLAPGDPKVHYNLSILYQNRKDVPAAVAELRQAAKLAPDWPTPHIMLAKLLKDSDPKAALDQCVIADGLTQDAKLHDLCQELQKKSQ